MLLNHLIIDFKQTADNALHSRHHYFKKIHLPNEKLILAELKKENIDVN